MCIMAVLKRLKYVYVSLSCRTLLPDERTCLLASLLFVVHPVHVESVTPMVRTHIPSSKVTHRLAGPRHPIQPGFSTLYQWRASCSADSSLTPVVAVMLPACCRWVVPTCCAGASTCRPCCSTAAPRLTQVSQQLLGLARSLCHDGLSLGLGVKEASGRPPSIDTTRTS